MVSQTQMPCHVDFLFSCGSFALRIHSLHHRKPQLDTVQRQRDCGSLAPVHTSLTDLQHLRLGGASMKGFGWSVEWLQEPEVQEVCSERPKNDNINRHANAEGGKYLMKSCSQIKNYRQLVIAQQGRISLFQE